MMECNARDIEEMKWYALFVKSGCEENVCKYLKTILEHKVSCNFVIPKRELTERQVGTTYVVLKPLFSGYILVETMFIYKLYDILHNSFWHTNLYKILGEEGHFQEIYKEEMEPILNLLNKDGIIKHSTVLVEKEKIIVTSGPLIGYIGRIKRINKRKCRARIVLKFLGKSTEMDIGIKCIQSVRGKEVKKEIHFPV